MPLYNLYGPYNMKPINIYNLDEFRGKRRFGRWIKWWKHDLFEFLGRFLVSNDDFSEDFETDKQFSGW